MGRGNLSRFALALAAAALFAQAAAGALPYRVLATGRTEGSGNSPHVYVAASASAPRSWISRLSPHDRAAVARVDFARREVGAIFLDGSICGSDPALTSFARVRDTVRVKVAFTRPPIGFATCIRTDTPYIVFTFARTRKPATHIHATVVARA